MAKKDKKAASSKDKGQKNPNEEEKSDNLDKKMTSDDLKDEFSSVDPTKGEKHDETSNTTQDTNSKEEKEVKKDNEKVEEEKEEEPEDQSNIYENKDKGNKLFAEGDVDGAIKLWSKSINSLSYILNKSRSSMSDEVTMEALNEYTSMYVSLSLNLSLAHLKKENYDKCKEYCQYVLMYDEKNLKAHLRIVKADLKLNNLDRALSNCEKGLEYNPDDAELLFLKKSVLEQLKKYEKKEKGFYSKAFKELEPDPRTEEDPMVKFQKSKLYRFNYRLLMFYSGIFDCFKKVWKLLTVTVNMVLDSVDGTAEFVVNSYNKVKSKLKGD